MRRQRTVDQWLSPVTLAALAVACLLIPSRIASAQAFLPPAGEGSITVAYQNLFARGHLDLNGDRMSGESGHDPTQTHSASLEGEFGLTRWLAVDASVPYIAAKYGGSAPHRVGGVGEPREWDDGTYHGTVQDFRLGVRFNVRARPFSLTPFVDAIIPSHHYPSVAHAAVGKDLRALVVGGAVGGFLDAVTPGLFFQAQTSYAFVQDVLDIHPNRSRVDSEVGYFITPRLAVRFLESYQFTYNGLDVVAFASPMVEAHVHDHPEVEVTGPYRNSHDRLLRSNYLNLGAGVGFGVTESLEIFAAALNTVWGENVHPLRGLTVGVNMHFSTRRPHP